MSTYEASATFGTRGDVQRAQTVVDAPVVLAVQVVRPLLFVRLFVPYLVARVLLDLTGLRGLLVTLSAFAVAIGATLATNVLLDRRTGIRIGSWSGYLVTTDSDLLVVRGGSWSGGPVEVTARFPLSSVHVQARQFGVLLELPDGRRARLSVRGISFGTVRADAVAHLVRTAGA